MMDMTRQSRILEIYHKSQQQIHVSCENGRFYNGTIMDLDLDKNLLILLDKMIGPVPILFEEIKVVEPYRVEGGEN